MPGLVPSPGRLTAVARRRVSPLCSVPVVAGVVPAAVPRGPAAAGAAFLASRSLPRAAGRLSQAAALGGCTRTRPTGWMAVEAAGCIV